MKTSFRHNDKDIFVGLTLINGRIGFDKYSSGDSDVRDRYTEVFIPSNIISFEFGSDIINPIPVATLIYEDDRFSTMLNSHGNIEMYVQAEIRLTSKSVQTEVAPEKDETFKHLFYVDNIHIMERNGNIIKYRIDLISHIYFLMMERRGISTYANENGRTCIDLLKELFREPLSLNTGDRTSSTPIHFISDANSTLYDNMVDILDANIVSPEDDLILLPYNHMTGKHEIWLKSDFDSSDKEPDYDKLRNVLKITIDSVADYDPFANEIGDLSTKSIFMNKNVIKATADMRLYFYDYDKRAITPVDYPAEHLSRTFGSSLTDIGFRNRFSNDLGFIRNNIQLINEHNNSKFIPLFERFTNCLLKNSILVVNTNGSIFRRSGMEMFVVTDAEKRVSSSLIQFNGRWLAVKVRHIFSPRSETYMNTIMLSRSDIPDDAESFKENI